ncbi:codeine O-demethylase-like [Tripterygium wilfordii]|uniref:Codeine O-demethylase-like n=1 Tax=Tripterygium wilfordii TaxID=458696 RepID=A0A7J7CVY6_TRIWF|nr:codeine O-demethylase-like [Tripterygium wilfordii]
MENEIARLGSSPTAMVPCLKELLIKETLTTVPPRFVRSDLDPPFISSDAATPHIPVIDFHKLTSPEFMDTELQKFHHACRDWSFFQLINHGVEDSVVEKVKLEVQEFFNLPIEEKKKLWQKPGEVEGFGQAFVRSEEQKLDWIITNETYRSIEHRATVNSEKERFSIATFFNPKQEKEIGPASSLVTPENPALFGRITVGDFYKGYFSRELRDKKFLKSTK